MGWWPATNIRVNKIIFWPWHIYKSRTHKPDSRPSMNLWWLPKHQRAFLVGSLEVASVPANMCSAIARQSDSRSTNSFCWAWEAIVKIVTLQHWQGIGKSSYLAGLNAVLTMSAWLHMVSGLFARQYGLFFNQQIHPLCRPGTHCSSSLKIPAWAVKSKRFTRLIYRL